MSTVNRLLVFDPAKRRVWFSSVSQKDETFSESITLGKKDQHRILAMWNDDGVLVGVDGKEKGSIGDDDPRKQPIKSDSTEGESDREP